MRGKGDKPQAKLAAAKVPKTGKGRPRTAGRGPDTAKPARGGAPGKTSKTVIIESAWPWPFPGSHEAGEPETTPAPTVNTNGLPARYRT